MNDARLTSSKGHLDEGMPGVWLLRQTNTLRVLVPLETNFKGNLTNIEVQTCDVENIPLQRWVSINITISDNILDVWVDGYLRKSFSLAGFPKINENALHVCPDGGFDGYLSKLSVSNAPLSIKKIKEIYEKGPTLKPNFMARLSNALLDEQLFLYDNDSIIFCTSSLLRGKHIGKSVFNILFSLIIS